MEHIWIVAAWCVGALGLAVVCDWISRRYRRFMDAPRSPEFIAHARAVFRVWFGLKLAALCLIGAIVGAFLWGLFGAVLGALGVLFVLAVREASHPQ